MRTSDELGDGVLATGSDSGVISYWIACVRTGTC